MELGIHHTDTYHLRKIVPLKGVQRAFSFSKIDTFRGQLIKKVDVQGITIINTADTCYYDGACVIDTESLL